MRRIKLKWRKNSGIVAIPQPQQAESELRARERQQAAVAKLGQLALADADLSMLMNSAVALVAQSLEVEYSKVLELLPSGNALLLRAGVGWQAGLVGQATVGAGSDSQAGYTLLSSEPVIVSDLRKEKRFNGPPLLHDHGVVSGLSVIIQGQNRRFGVFGAHTTRRRTFTQDDIHFLQAVANVLALAIDRKQAESALRKARDELEIRVRERTAELCLANQQLLAENTERKRAESQLLHNAFHDALTGLPNRTLFMDRLVHAVEHRKRHEDYLIAVLFLDLDRFKVINDSLGHIQGDQFLITIAKRLKACLRPTDTVARLGGDEFTILLEGIKDVSEAIKVASRIQEELALPFALDGQEVFATASIGIALSTTGYDQPEDLLRKADMAMYRAKALGKARYELFNTDMYVTAVVKLQLETELRQAIKRQEFRVYYQPIVALTSGRILGFEALVRWQHPDRGLVFPEDFIKVAEETGLIVSIGYWVLREACRQMQTWLVRTSVNSVLKISVNISAKQFSQPDLIQQISQILRETGLNACSLNLEITESVIMENSASAIATLSQLRELGIQLSIDDFGTGYSSLGRLHQFPINVLKIDRSFVSSIGVNSGNLEITETIVTLAHNLGVNVTAEGVETQEQLALLRELKCEYGQGYFFSAPLDSSKAEALIVASVQW